MNAPTIERIRAQFPAFTACSDVLLDNAGGSQVPRSVADAMHAYMLSTYVQLGADYQTSRASTRIVARAHEMTEVLMGVGEVGKVILGPSTSALLAMLADCLARSPAERDEIIVAETNHESNIGPWVRLNDRGHRVRLWRVDREAQACPIDHLRAMLSERTRLVAVPHVSNILGKVEEIGEIVRLAHAVGARVVVDGVAFAPHRAIDVRAFGVDWYVFSMYKVFGPHMAALYGTHEALRELEGPNHFFIAPDDVPYTFEVGGVSHEACAAWLGLWTYLEFLAGEREALDPERFHAPLPFERAVVERAFARVRAIEAPLQERLLDALGERGDVRLIGPAHAGESRVPTISFAIPGRRSREIAHRLNARSLGVRFGHFYAHRLCEAMGLDPADGVVRISLAHTNTFEEVERVLDELAGALAIA